MHVFILILLQTIDTEGTIKESIRYHLLARAYPTPVYISTHQALDSIQRVLYVYVLLYVFRFILNKL